METLSNISIVQRRQQRSTRGEKVQTHFPYFMRCKSNGKLLNEKVLNYLQNQSLICNEQAWFLPGQSTVTQLCFLINRWQGAIDWGEGVEAIFLDFSKAYDRVSIPGLIYKLSCVGFSQAALKWFSSFLTDRQQQVRVHGSESSWETVK